MPANMKSQENLITGIVKEPSGRITRAQAAALHKAAQLPLKGKTDKNQVQPLQTAPQRAACDDGRCLQHKRRAVLQDVTNIFCEPSYRKCLIASKIEAKNGKLSNKCPKKDSKAVPVGGSKKHEVQFDPKIQRAQKKVKTNSHLQELNHSSNSIDQELPSQLDMIKRCTNDRGQLEICTSQGPSNLQSNEGKGANLRTISCHPGILDIDSDNRDPRMCSLYAPDIYQHLLAAELVRRPHSDLMVIIQQDITQSMRNILVDWVVEVCEEYKLVPDTLYLAVHMVDWFLSRNYIERQQLQLLGITCMLIASKYEEVCAPRVEDFCFITDNTYTKSEVLRMEGQVLNFFGFQLSVPTTKTFLRRFLRAAQASYEMPGYELEFLSDYLAELSLMDRSFLNFLPSIIAASVLFLSKWTLDQKSHPWNPTLEHYTSYKASDLRATVFALQDQQLNTKGCLLSAVRSKYRQERFKTVAALSSPKLLETLF